MRKTATEQKNNITWFYFISSGPNLKVKKENIQSMIKYLPVCFLFFFFWTEQGSFQVIIRVQIIRCKIWNNPTIYLVLILEVLLHGHRMNCKMGIQKIIKNRRRI